MFLFEQVQHITAPMDKVWPFFANPKNLALLTPSDMKFRILDQLPDEIENGLVVRFKVNVLGIPVNWTSLIQRTTEPGYFNDLQVEGPFNFWYHQHYFKEVEGGVEVKDRLYYLPPFGFIGKLFHPLIVKRKLIETFEYRYHKINELFGNAKSAEV